MAAFPGGKGKSRGGSQRRKGGKSPKIMLSQESEGDQACGEGGK